MMMFIVKSTITLTLLYSCVWVLLRNNTFHRFNRWVLLGVMLSAFVVPMLHVSIDSSTVINLGIRQMGVLMEDNAVLLSEGGTQDQQYLITWAKALKWIYLAGLAIILTVILVQLVRLVRLMHRGIRHQDEQGNTIILFNCDVSPFSIFKLIVMSVKDYETESQYILPHERQHIRLGHSYDLMLLQLLKVIQWFNPIVYIIGRDLMTIHEFEADQAVLQQGVDAKSYQLFLVNRVVGNRLQPFANNLNHGSLKKRITMMYRKKSNRWLMLKALMAIPVTALILSSFATLDNTGFMKEMVNIQEDTPFSIHPIRDQYGRIIGLSHEGKPADGDFECTYEYVFINGRPATEEEVKNYKSLPIRTFQIIKTANGSVEYNYKDKQGIICLTLEDDNIDGMTIE